MSKGLSYHYSGTKGYIVNTIQNLPNGPSTLLHNGWTDVSHPAMAKTGSSIYRENSTGLKVRFDESASGKSGFSGKNHYHILNPNATSNRDMYLDKNGNVVAKGHQSITYSAKLRLIMTLHELVATYNLHDSYFEDIIYNENSRQLIMKINFCFWMQENYTEGTPENGTITILFEDVSNLSYRVAEINCNTLSIIATEVQNTTIIFKLTDDLNQEYMELSFDSSQAIITV
jgi:hypothetical protein